MLLLRRWQPADARAVFELHNRALEAVDAHAGNGPWDDDLHHVTEVYLDSGGEFLVGELDGVIVAMGALRRLDPGTAELTRMRVDPVHWRRGIGRALLNALEARARELGVSRLTLTTTAGQTAAQRLYESTGYRLSGHGSQGRFALLHYAKELT